MNSKSRDITYSLLIYAENETTLLISDIYIFFPYKSEITITSLQSQLLSV